jgi:hypothetical protein
MSAAGWKELRLLAAFAVIGFAMAGLAMLAVTGGRSGGAGSLHASGPRQFTPVERAAYVTSAAQGYRFFLDVTGNVAGHSVTVTGSGRVEGGRGSLKIDADGTSLSAVFVYPSVYIRTPDLPTGSSMAPTPWIKASLGPGLQSAAGGDSIGSPSQMVDYLKASGSVALVGGDWVRGVPTTHYHALVDLDRYASAFPPSLRSAAAKDASAVERLTGQSTMPMDVWIDAQHRVRRLANQVSVCSPAGPITQTFQLDIYDYGRQPPIKLPDPSQVTEITPKQQSQGGGALPQLQC